MPSWRNCLREPRAGKANDRPGAGADKRQENGMTRADLLGRLLVAAQFALLAWLIWPLTAQRWSLPALALLACAIGARPVDARPQPARQFQYPPRTQVLGAAGDQRPLPVYAQSHVFRRCCCSPRPKSSPIAMHGRFFAGSRWPWCCSASRCWRNAACARSTPAMPNMQERYVGSFRDCSDRDGTPAGMV